MNKTKDFFEILAWHKENQNNYHKKDIWDATEKAYNELINYYSEKGRFNDLEMDFLFYNQEQWLFEWGASINKKLTICLNYVTDGLNALETIENSDHYLNRFTKNNYKKYFQIKEPMVKDHIYFLENK